MTGPRNIKLDQVMASSLREAGFENYILFEHEADAETLCVLEHMKGNKNARVVKSSGLFMAMGLSDATIRLYKREHPGQRPLITKPGIKEH